MKAIAPALEQTTYFYLDANLREIHMTQVPKSDQEAVEYFAAVESFGPGYLPRYVQRQHTYDLRIMLPWEYKGGYYYPLGELDSEEEPEVVLPFEPTVHEFDLDWLDS